MIKYCSSLALVGYVPVVTSSSDGGYMDAVDTLILRHSALSCCDVISWCCILSLDLTRCSNTLLLCDADIKFEFSLEFHNQVKYVRVRMCLEIRCQSFIQTSTDWMQRCLNISICWRFYYGRVMLRTWQVIDWLYIYRTCLTRRHTGADPEIGHGGRG